MKQGYFWFLIDDHEGNNLGERGAQMLSEALSHSSTLTSLDLSGER